MLLFSMALAQDAPLIFATELVYELLAALPAACNPPVRIRQGDTFTLVFPVLLPGGSPVAYAAPTYSFALTNAPYATDGAAPLLTKTGALEESEGVWSVVVQFARADTLSLPAGAHYFEVMVADGSNENIVATGSLGLLATIIRP